MSWLLLSVEYITSKLAFDFTIGYNEAARLFERAIYDLNIRGAIFILSVQNAFDKNIIMLFANSGISTETRVQVSQHDPMWLRRHRLRSFGVLAGFLAVIPLAIAVILGIFQRIKHGHDWGRVLLDSWWILTIMVIVFFAVLWLIYHTAYMAKHKRPQSRTVQFIVDTLLFVFIVITTHGLKIQWNHHVLYERFALHFAFPLLYVAAALQLVLIIWWAIECYDLRNKEVIKQVVRELRVEERKAMEEGRAHGTAYTDETIPVGGERA